MTCQTKVGTSSEFPRQLVVNYIYQALKPNKVASLPEVAPLPLLHVPLPKALAFYMKKSRIMFVKLLKYVVKRSNGGLSYFVSLLASPDPLPLLLPVPLALHKNKVKAS